MTCPMETKKGIPAAVVTIEWIESNYPLGCDLQETIRNFLIEVKSQHPSLAYVLINLLTDLFSAVADPRIRLGGPA